MNGLVGGPLLVGGLGPGPHDPLNPALNFPADIRTMTSTAAFKPKLRTFFEFTRLYRFYHTSLVQKLAFTFMTGH